MVEEAIAGYSPVEYKKGTPKLTKEIVKEEFLQKLVSPENMVESIVDLVRAGPWRPVRHEVLGPVCGWLEGPGVVGREEVDA